MANAADARGAIRGGEGIRGRGPQRGKAGWRCIDSQGLLLSVCMYTARPPRGCIHSFILSICMVLLLLAKGEYFERFACVVQIFVEAARRLETSRRIEDIRSNRIQYSKGCRNLQEETKETLARSLGKGECLRLRLRRRRLCSGEEVHWIDGATFLPRARVPVACQCPAHAFANTSKHDRTV